MNFPREWPPPTIIELVADSCKYQTKRQKKQTSYFSLGDKGKSRKEPSICDGTGFLVLGFQILILAGKEPEN